MKTHNLGYPRIGSRREIKKACEHYWVRKITREALQDAAWQICIQNWHLQQQAGIDLIPSNDFSYYDQVLDMVLNRGCTPTLSPPGER